MPKRRAAAAAAVLLALLLSAPARAGDPIMPLSSVRPGMVCAGLSVVQGTAISEFEVRVVDVIAGEPTVGGPRILVRVSGPAVDDTGVGPGFSGSPFYCRDSDGVRRNAGAIAEGVGDYGNDVALATPIEEILEERPAAAPRARRDPDLRRSARSLAGPLTATGLSTRARRLLLRAGRRARLQVLAVPAGPLGGYPVQSLRPGSSVAVSIASGELALGSVGTVAYRDGANVWAFGHPLEAVGPRSLFLQDAYVFTVVSNPIGGPEFGSGTYKLATSGGHTVGSVTNDASAAVVGTVGPQPSSVALKASARDGDSGRARFVSARLADERALGLGASASLAAPLAVTQAVDRLLRSSRPITLSMCVRFRARGLKRRFGFCNPYFSLDDALVNLGDAADLVESYDFTPLGLTEISARVRFRRGVREDVLVAGRGPRRVRPGQRIAVSLTARRRRGGTRAIRVRFRLPRSLRPGRRAVVLEGTGSGEGGDAEEQLARELLESVGEDGDDDEKEPRSLRALVRRVEALRRRPGIAARYRRRGRKQLVHEDENVRFSGKVRIPLRVVRRRR